MGFSILIGYMRFLSLLIGKTVLGSLRLLGRSGSALPGLIIEKISPNFLGSMLEGLPKGVVLVTGTNGKTTTTKVVSELLESQGLRVLTNKTGSNFVRGTVTTVIDKAKLTGKLPYDIAIFELDEAHAVHFVKQVKPKGVLVLNIMRDQMDRFGEIDTTAKLIARVVGSATDWIVLNSNDERVARMLPDNGVKALWYGHSEKLQPSFLTDDELHHQDSASYTIAGDMDVELISFKDKEVGLKLASKNYLLTTTLSGSHNAINLAAALAVVRAVLPDVSIEEVAYAMKKLQPAFGRGEVIRLKNGQEITLQLVKNPGGFTHALRMVSLKAYQTVGIAINDDYADGRDVSWLWDVDFTALKNDDTKLICGGTRGHDMAVRLKYDELKAACTEVDLAAFVAKINETNNTAIIFCTYTAMLKIRELYKKYSEDVYGVEV